MSALAALIIQKDGFCRPSGSSRRRVTDAQGKTQVIKKTCNGSPPLDVDPVSKNERKDDGTGGRGGPLCVALNHL